MFTNVSTIYSKLYLNSTNDPHTLSLVSYVFCFILFLFKSNLNEIKKVTTNKAYVYLALFNIGTVLLTNIGINQTSVSLTYMIKVSFLLQNKYFVFKLNFYFLNERINSLDFLFISFEITVIKFTFFKEFI